MKRREIKKKQKRKGKEKKIGIINDMQVKKKKITLKENLMKMKYKRK